MEYKEDLINYRIEKAWTTMSEAELAFAHNKLSLTENRLYYSIFYIVSALSIKYNFSSAKHINLKGWFNKNFVHTGEVDISFGKIYSKAFEKRQKGDYDDFVIFHKDEVKLDMENAKKFLEKIEPLIRDSDQGKPGDSLK